MLSRVKKNDLVCVTSGKYKGKQGRVIALNMKKFTVMVKGVAIVTRHVKARRQGEKSGIIKEESYIPLAKVMPVCASCKKPCRVRVKFVDGEGVDKVRACHRCNEVF